MKLLLIIVVCLLLNGCYGAGVGVFSSKTVLTDQTSYLTKDDLLRRHGTPTKIEKIAETEEVYFYNNGLGWTGVMPYIAVFFPVPVPLMIPTRNNWDEYHLIGDRVQSKKSQITQISGCFWGYAPENEGTMRYKWTGKCD
ncbi:hypothetical protein KOM00_05955 [Geomonas sp. Red69]|uniref:Lipoprotein n=1 Tax=Geomonas diazotrophica TaxID=2843197 RepID=A0ABX8JFA9_9BACT|nr:MULTISPECIES: hypothetical protein [Geomonas]MBU5636273.1 hypothetical protein [Geomonas diazotrophica]QWV96167.1 hypothetical protein KP005_12330 [Geomonas nitrogeniifigens]QXE85234.1 hypothetical protein KP003_12610 [Geomonas nitrogeniifigens]